MPNVRSFNGTSDYIKCGMGSVDPTRNNAAKTLGILFKPASVAGARTLLSVVNTVPTQGWYWRGNGTSLQTSDATNTPSAGTIAAGTWYWALMSKTAGSATPRSHIKDLTAGTAMAHANYSGACGSSFNAGSLSIYFGAYYTSSNFFSGLIAAAAYWTTALSDAATEAITSFDTLTASSPAALWYFQQASTADPVNDDVGSADQSAISGTTVTSEPIPNFDTGGAVAGWTTTVVY